MKFKRIIAISGIVILGALYIATLISAIFTTPAAPQLFKACVYATVAVPVMMYAYLLIYKLVKNKSEANRKEFNETIEKQAEAARKAESRKESSNPKSKKSN